MAARPEKRLKKKVKKALKPKTKRTRSALTTALKKLKAKFMSDVDVFVPEGIYYVEGSHFNSYFGDHISYADFGIGERLSIDGRYAYRLTHEQLTRLLKKVQRVVHTRWGSSIIGEDWIKFAQKPALPAEAERLLLSQNPFLEQQFDFDSWNGQNAAGFSYITARIFGPALKRKIIINVPHGDVREWAPRGAFQIHIWSAPPDHPTRPLRPPPVIFGIPVECRDHGYVPTDNPSGVILKDGGDGYAYGEVFENAFYVYFDAVNTGSPSELKLWARICLEAVRVLTDDKVTMKDRLLEAQRKFAESQRVMFGKIVNRAIPARGQRTRDLIKLVDDRLARIQKEWFEAERERFGLVQNERDPQEVAAHFAAEIEKLQAGKVAKVERVVIDANGEHPLVRIFTDEIRSLDSYTGRTHLLGRFEIVLRLGTGSIWFRNLERRLNNYHAGHISTDIDGYGKPCLGSIQKEISSYIGNYEVEAAVTLAIAFLETPNVADSAGAQVRLFPIVEEPQHPPRT